MNSIFDEVMNFSDTNGDEKKLKPSERLLKDIVGYGYNMDQLEVVLKTKENQLIISSAGSGKTTAIIFKVIYDLKTGRSTKLVNINNNNIRVPDSIWVSTFLKTGTEELKNSYRRWSNRLHCTDVSSAIQFSTLHAEFKRVLNTLGMSTEIIDENANKNLLRKVLKTYNVKNSQGKQINQEELESLIGAFTRTRNRLDEKRYESDVYADFALNPAIVDCILRDWKNERIIDNKVDFEDLQEILYEKCYVENDEKIIDYLANRYNYIYIDEFQDTSQVQYAVLKIYASKCKQIVAIGDDDQTIYSWRGSDNSIITEKFMEDFNPIKNDLSVNFRCPSNILNAIKPSIQKNKKRFNKSLRSSEDGGIFRIGGFSGYRYMATALADMVYEDVKNGMSVAVLCRVNSDGLMPALFFDSLNKFSFSISSKNMSLDSYIGRMAISIVKLMTDNYSADVKRALSQLTWDTYGVTRLIDVCKSNKVNIWTIDEDDLKYSCPEIAEKILEWRGFRETTDDITTMKLILQEYRYNVFVKDTQFNDVMKSVLVSIESILDYYNFDSVEEFLSELEDTNDRLLARESKVKTQVKIATVHEYKGKEADSVYIWNDSEDVFPYKRSKNSLEDYEEERRIHYIACTRAKKISTVMYIKSKKSSFINEMDLSNAVVLSGKTSGVIQRELTKSMEETKAMKDFVDEVSADTGSLDDDGNEIE